jgi:opacity protein-like surface antigen
MDSKRIIFAVCLMFAGCVAAAQNVELTIHAGGQINGGVDLSTIFFNRIEVGNGASYGITAGYLLTDRFGLEFQWNHNKADTLAQPTNGTTSIKLFSLDTNQYFGNFIFHFADRETPLRPFVFGGLGAASLTPATRNVNGITRFAFAVGGGAKYNVSEHIGFRGQVKFSPTYLTTTNGGYWCDPFWGGCWTVGNNHYLNEVDISGGITFRF